MKQKKSYSLKTVPNSIDTMDVKGTTAIDIKSSVDCTELRRKNGSGSRLMQVMKMNKSAREAVQIGVGEIIGTGILMFLGCMGCIGKTDNPPPSWQGSFTFGLAVFMAVQTVGHLSGAHLNPCVTLGSAIMELTSVPLALIYMICQFIGAIIGFGIIHVVLPSKHIHSGNPNKSADFCVTLINEDISVMQGLIFEIIATGLLLLLICSMWDKRNAANTDSSSIKPGLAVFVLCVAIAPYTGCSMNPARTLAPAIFNNQWTNHWVYWIGPIIGSLLATIFYKFMYWSKLENNLIEN